MKKEDMVMRYTLEEASIILAEQRYEARRERNYFLKQKLMGFLLIVISLLLALLAFDLTAAVVLVPLGTFLMLTKSRVLSIAELPKQDEIMKT